MNVTFRKPIARILMSASLSVTILSPLTSAAADQMLFDFNRDFDLSTVEARDAEVAVSQTDGDIALRINTGHAQRWPGITLKAPSGRWDLSQFEKVTMDVTNLGKKTVRVMLRADSPSPDGKRVYVQDGADIPPNETRSVSTVLPNRLPKELAPKLFGMRGYPDGLRPDKGIDPSHVDQVLIFVSQPEEDYVFAIDNIRAAGRRVPSELLSMDEKDWFPMIDAFGQYIHKDWPGKTHSVGDLTAKKKQESADLKNHSGPDGWNQYGGFAAGPQLEATGFFRPEKYRGKWWLVDPEGRLFWSHGTDCVRWSTGYTPITDRKHWFRDLPATDPPFGQFYGKGAWAPHGYYEGRRYETYNFTGSNLLRKYGDGWREQFSDLCHQRLRSWGMNTIANWSDSGIYLQRKTPYVVSIHVGHKSIEGSSGYWGKFPDPFDPGFRESLEKRLSNERGKSAGDAWCLGYFIDNELGWGDELSLAIATLASPADQPAKRVFLEDLKRQYETIEQLNQAWKTKHASWQALMASQVPPDKSNAKSDLANFYTRIAEEYFRVCRESVKSAAPNQLYLGCRFAWVNDRAVRAAAKYCDVIGFNRYRDSVADFSLPEGVDKPAIIGEFHFGALDRGMFHTGLRPTANQAERAEAYRDYVRGALENPYLVGTHWFQFGDQATTGRGDGENYQIGFLDICDTPYSETINASRDVGYSLYQHRLDQKD